MRRIRGICDQQRRRHGVCPESEWEEVLKYVLGMAMMRERLVHPDVIG